MKPIFFLLLLTMPAVAQDVVKITSQHQLIPSATSPITVRMESRHDLYAFYLEGSTSKQKNGQSCTFEAPNGVRWLRVVGLDWKDGILKPVEKKESQILIVNPGQSQPWSEPVQQAPVPTAPKPRTIPKVASVPSAYEPPLIDTIEPMEPVATVKKPLDGWRIEMRTNPDIPCVPCNQWKAKEWPRYIAEGAEVLEIQQKGIKPVPQFRIIHNGKATKWMEGYMTADKFRRAMEVLKK